MGYHIKTTPSQDARLRAVVGTPASPATDAQVLNKIVLLVYQYLVRQEARDAIKAAKESIVQAQIAAGLLRQQEMDVKNVAEQALVLAQANLAGADNAKPGHDWDQ